MLLVLYLRLSGKIALGGGAYRDVIQTGFHAIAAILESFLEYIVHACVLAWTKCSPCLSMYMEGLLNRQSVRVMTVPEDNFTRCSPNCTVFEWNIRLAIFWRGPVNVQAQLVTWLLTE